MKAEIINIGDELLIGQVINTNAAWMAEQLNLSGIPVHQVTVISDRREHILEALKEAEHRAEIVLLSGGIGPTLDDITKQTLCEFFNTRLVFSGEAYHDIETLFAGRGYPMTESNRKQAELPECCISIPNMNGTARGMWFEKERPGGGKTVFVSMPGVPFEMKEMMSRTILPRLCETFHPPFILHRTLLTQGVGESFLAERLEEWERSLSRDIRLAYLPQPGIVRLRLSALGPDEAELHRKVNAEVVRLEALLPDCLFGYDDDTLEEVVGRKLARGNATIATAESCTGGTLASLITRIPGSSAYFKGSVVAYANEIKSGILGVEAEDLRRHGAVSREVVLQMARGVQTLFGTDYAIATTGIAGPGGGSAEKPVGTAWIGIATPHGVTAHHFLFGDHRERNIRRTVLAALNLLRKAI